MKRIYLVVLILSVLATACKKGKVSPESAGPVTPVTPVIPVDAIPSLPAAAKDGVVFINNGASAIVTLYAPYKKSVALIGEFNDWQPTAMKNTADGNIWWVQIDNLNPSIAYAYQFLVDDNLKVADPYCEKILDQLNDSYIDQTTYPGLKAYPTGKTTGIVSVMQANQPTYTWKSTSGFTRPAKNNLVIYELLIRDFTVEHNYSSTLQKLDYLVGLGVNAIELMPVNEFEGNLSWGYNPSFYFAPDKYYGTKTALQNFIDECHGKGLAVILDMVLNHSFGQSPLVQLYFDQPSGKPLAISPWFNTNSNIHPYNVGYDFNHESAATKVFAKNVMKFWMQEYKIDGFRFDLSKGFTQKGSSDDASFSAYDASRVAIWKDYNNYIKSIDANNFYLILEHFADAAEEKVLADEGMMLWNGLNVNMNEATMGWSANSDFSWAFFTRHGFTRSENLINFIESHDEERTMYKNLNYGNATGSYSVKDLAVALKREEMAAAFLFAVPGPKMIWQFEELGYDVSINYNGRTGNKPIHWEYFQQTERKALYDAYAKFINMKKKNSIFNATDAIYNLTAGIKYIKLTEGTNTVVVIGNFDVSSKDTNVDFGASGIWYDASTGSQMTLNSTMYTKTLAAGEYHIYSRMPLNGG
ncbi:alpha-amylase family glycosyl hydrolase [Pedobacter nyackensis]|uniref:1,4-alpha-glucan branching enzyme n=1 Tax=Pedobacter nyackensis TaxID=475255 RepID=A0A1W2B4V7_9SPHI|nr:alpha-amylase family glycosyl hydrolase [Pedobacter nyackensis]SMC68033.1 1,4-alpha-glucan branching enzyme [Pedobacter nyackensis]